MMLFAAVGVAAERHWQTGKWVVVNTKRRAVDFTPGVVPHGGTGQVPSPTANLHSNGDVKIYVIETDDLRIELEDVAKANTRSLDAVVGLPVVFALEKNSVYIRDSDNVEHKLRVTNKTNRKKS